MSQQSDLQPTRRIVLGGSILAAALPLAACGNKGGPQAIPEPTGTAHDVMEVSRLPVGGASSVKVGSSHYLLYRPDEKTVLAYTAVCTHQGCQVGTGSGEVFKCPCHGSEYLRSDGAVSRGPAPKPLQRYAAAIEGSKVVIYL